MIYVWFVLTVLGITWDPASSPFQLGNQTWLCCFRGWHIEADSTVKIKGPSCCCFLGALEGLCHCCSGHRWGVVCADCGCCSCCTCPRCLCGCKCSCPAAPLRIPLTSGSAGCCLLCVLLLPFILDTLDYMLVCIASVGILRHYCLYCLVIHLVI
jgi:hypothetical protein